MKRLECVIEGSTPLLMHNPMGQMKRSEPGRKKVPKAEEEAALGRYLMNGKDELGLPTIAIRNCILGGAKGYKAGRVSLTSVLPGCLNVPPEDGMVPLLRKGKALSDYVVDVRRAVVQRQGVLRARAKIEPPWTVKFVIAYDDAVLGDAFSDSLLGEIIGNAGTSVGLLDYRPATKGWFGKFTLESVKEVK